MKKRDQPHDRFYKDLMQDIGIARKFLLTYLDKKIQDQVDWPTLSLYDPSLTGGANKQLYADLVYTAQTKQHKIDVFFILNHERKADPFLPIRSLEYILGTLKKSIKQKQQPAFIVHLTWYNGKKGPYPYVQSIYDYFKEKQLARDLLLDSCRVINPHDIPDQELASHEDLSVLELFMKHADNPNFLSWIASHPEIARQLAENKYIKRSLEYVVDVGSHTLEDLLATFEKISDKLKETMLTTAQQIRKEGMQQGMQEEKLVIARTMLTKGYDPNEVKTLTGISQEAISKIKPTKKSENQKKS